MEPVISTVAPGEIEASATTTASDFDRIEKRTLADRHGVPFREFKVALKPRFVKVWLDLLPGHAALAVILAGAVWAQAALPRAAVVAAAALGALLIGYTLAYIELFFHEAAHYNSGDASACVGGNVALGLGDGDGVG